MGESECKREPQITNDMTLCITVKTGQVEKNSVVDPNRVIALIKLQKQFPAFVLKALHNAFLGKMLFLHSFFHGSDSLEGQLSAPALAELLGVNVAEFHLRRLVYVTVHHLVNRNRIDW